MSPENNQQKNIMLCIIFLNQSLCFFFFSRKEKFYKVIDCNLSENIMFSSEIMWKMTISLEGLFHKLFSLLCKSRNQNLLVNPSFSFDLNGLYEQIILKIQGRPPCNPLVYLLLLSVSHFIILILCLSTYNIWKILPVDLFSLGLFNCLEKVHCKHSKIYNGTINFKTAFLQNELALLK